MSEARERVLQASAKLFAQRGYESVTVKDIASALNMHHSSLYHHINPGGKERLYIEVMERNFQLHQQGIQQAIEDGDGNLRSQLQNIAAWLLSQSPLNMTRMTHSDVPALKDKASAEELLNMAHITVLLPVSDLLKTAQKQGEITHPHLGNIAGGIISMIEGLHAIPDEYVIESREAMANELIDVFLAGLRI